MTHDHGHNCGSHGFSTPSVHQSLDEMAFERGVWSAAMDGEEDRVTRYLDGGGDPKAQDSAGYAPLHYASRNNHYTTCQILIQRGGDVNGRTRSGQATPLHRAAYCGHSRIVRLLLDNRADPSIQDSDGKTPLHKAAEGGHVDVAELILTSKPETVNVQDKHNRTAFDCITGKHEKLTKLLQTSLFAKKSDSG